MNLNKRYDANKLCRTCLQVLSDDTLDLAKHDIFLTPDIVKKLVLCTSLAVEPQDGYPKHLCDSCYVKVIEFYQFQRMCVESAQRFRESLQSCEAQDEVVCKDGEQPLVPKMEITIEETDVGMSIQNEYNSVKVEIDDCKKMDHQVTHMETYTISIISTGETNNAEKDISVKNEDENKEEDFNSDLDELPLSKLKKKVSNNKPESFTTAFRRNMDCYLPKQHICETCGKECETPAALRNHLTAHKDPSEYPFLCDQLNCGRRFTHKSYFDEHILRHAGIKNFVCFHCGLRKTTNKELRAHIKSHTSERRWSCKICTQAFVRSSNLKRHILLVHEKVRNFACSFCERKFGNKETLKYHEMTHTGEKPHQCTDCGKCFTIHATLRIHMKTHQRQQRSIVKQNDRSVQDTIFDCQHCKRGFSTRNNLMRHIRVAHNQEEDYACRFCTRKFSLKETLKYHEMTHTGEKLNECNECNKRFTHPATLRKHKKIHQTQLQQAK